MKSYVTEAGRIVYLADLARECENVITQALDDGIPLTKKSVVSLCDDNLPYSTMSIKVALCYVDGRVLSRLQAR